jgi:hypothetical protein
MNPVRSSLAANTILQNFALRFNLIWVHSDQPECVNIATFGDVASLFPAFRVPIGSGARAVSKGCARGIKNPGAAASCGADNGSIVCLAGS